MPDHDSSSLCKVCNGPMSGSGVGQSGICFLTRKCRVKAQRLRNAQRRAKQPKQCSKCRADLAPGNASGLCMVHYREFKAANVPRCMAEDCDRKLRASQKSSKTGFCGTHRPRSEPAGLVASAELSEAYDLDDGTLILDQIAIEIIVRGTRYVRLSHSERIEAVKRMIRIGDGVREISSKLHMRPEDIRPYLSELGYEVIRDEHITSRISLVIVPVRRSKNRILEPEMPQSNRPKK